MTDQVEEVTQILDESEQNDKQTTLESQPREPAAIKQQSNGRADGIQNEIQADGGKLSLTEVEKAPFTEIKECSSTEIQKVSSIEIKKVPSTKTVAPSPCIIVQVKPADVACADKTENEGVRRLPSTEILQLQSCLHEEIQLPYHDNTRIEGRRDATHLPSTEVVILHPSLNNDLKNADTAMAQTDGRVLISPLSAVNEPPARRKYRPCYCPVCGRKIDQSFMRFKLWPPSAPSTEEQVRPVLLCKKCSEQVKDEEELIMPVLNGRSVSSPVALVSAREEAWAEESTCGNSQQLRPMFSWSWQTPEKKSGTKLTFEAPERNADTQSKGLATSSSLPSKHNPIPLLVVRSMPTTSLRKSVLLGANSATRSQDSFFGPRSDSKPVRRFVSSSSQSAIICRICQMSESESGEPVKTTDCACKGGLEMIHRSCLVEWVRYKGANTCELCNKQFADVQPPERTESDIFRMQLRRQMLRHYASQRPLTNQKRWLMAAIVGVLILVTLVMIVLTIRAERNFAHATATSSSSTTTAYQRQSYIRFALCWSFLLFSGSLFLVVLVFWLCLEASLLYHRWRIRGLARLLVESLTAPPLRRPASAPQDSDIIISTPVINRSPMVIM